MYIRRANTNMTPMTKKSHFEPRLRSQRHGRRRLLDFLHTNQRCVCSFLSLSPERPLGVWRRETAPPVLEIANYTAIKSTKQNQKQENH